MLQADKTVIALMNHANCVHMCCYHSRRGQVEETKLKLVFTLSVKSINFVFSEEGELYESSFLFPQVMADLQLQQKKHGWEKKKEMMIQIVSSTKFKQYNTVTTLLQQINAARVGAWSSCWLQSININGNYWLQISTQWVLLTSMCDESE